ncbi:MAG: Rid family hydrolase [Planctomycetota bacterium]|jgi:enamine deaminase RidA (YjgF/YER057c/UK114 family)
MAVNLDTRSVESASTTEFYVSATPRQEAPLQNQAQEIFSGIRDILRSKNAYILQERVFSTQAAVETLCRARSEAYGDLGDGVAPSFLVGQEGLSGHIAGVQVHAIISDSRPEVVHLEGNACGRVLRLPGRAYLALSCISAPQPAQAAEQAQAMMKKGESVLRQFDADFLSVPRTWMWLKDILSWYDEFNRVRTGFFTDWGLIGAGSRQSMPASTGIGLGPADGGNCAMDLIAVLEPTDCTQYLQTTGKQHCAFKYGSAFSRAARTVMPAGETVFVSGTASINAGGATTHIGDALGQINATIENVRAVLSEMRCSDQDVVQVIAYCKTTEVEEVFNSVRNTLAWPWITVICDICRPDLLFEIEAAAMPR